MAAAPAGTGWPSGPGWAAAKQLELSLCCPICADFLKAPAGFAACPHVFCSLCIRRALVARGCCPVCREARTTPEVISMKGFAVVVENFMATRGQLQKLAATAPASAAASSSSGRSSGGAATTAMEAAAAVSFTTAAARENRLPARAYKQYSDKFIKADLEKWGCVYPNQAKGVLTEKEVSVWRHREFTTLFNANLDDLRPLPNAELVKVLKSMEAALKPTPVAASALMAAAGARSSNSSSGGAAAAASSAPAPARGSSSSSSSSGQSAAMAAGWKALRDEVLLNNPSLRVRVAARIGKDPVTLRRQVPADVAAAAAAATATAPSSSSSSSASSLSAQASAPLEVPESEPLITAPAGYRVVWSALARRPFYFHSASGVGSWQAPPGTVISERAQAVLREAKEAGEEAGAAVACALQEEEDENEDDEEAEDASSGQEEEDDDDEGCASAAEVQEAPAAAAVAEAAASSVPLSGRKRRRESSGDAADVDAEALEAAASEAPATARASKRARRSSGSPASVGADAAAAAAAAAAEPEPAAASAAPAEAAAASGWTCGHCTFLNDKRRRKCEMCKISRAGI